MDLKPFASRSLRAPVADVVIAVWSNLHRDKICPRRGLPPEEMTKAGKLLFLKCLRQCKRISFFTGDGSDLEHDGSLGNQGAVSGRR